MSWSPQRILIPVLAIAALAWVLLPGRGVRASAEAKIAIVDVSKVFESHPEQKKANETLKKEAERRKAEYEALLQAIQDLKAEQREVDRSSTRWAELEREVLKKKEEAKVRGRDSERAMNEQAVEVMREFLVEIEDTIEKYCRQNGITICLKSDAGPPMERGMDLALKSVVYHDASVDITDEISKIIQRKQPGGAGTPGGGDGPGSGGGEGE